MVLIDTKPKNDNIPKPTIVMDIKTIVKQANPMKKKKFHIYWMVILPMLRKSIYVMSIEIMVLTNPISNTALLIRFRDEANRMPPTNAMTRKTEYTMTE